MRYIPCIILILISHWLTGQKLFTLEMTTPDIHKAKAVFQSFTDSLSMVQYIENQIKGWSKDGYLTANVDSFFCVKDSCKVTFYKGKKYAFYEILLDTMWNRWNGEKKIMQQIVKQRGKLSSWPLASQEIVSYFMNRGYPFCRVFLQNIHVEEEKVAASLEIQKGDLFLYDSIVIKGDLQVSKNFIYRYLQLKKGQVYNHSHILSANQKSKNLIFSKVIEDPQVRFENGQALVYLFLNRAPINKFDFIIGVLPNNNVSGGTRKWTISGDLKAEFYNRFGQGEYIFGQYKKLRPENQEIILKYSMPYLYNFAFGIDNDFRLFRNGNQHLDLSYSGGIQYPFIGLNMLKFGFQYKSSRLIDINRQSIQTSGRLPLNLDVVYRSGVFSLQWLKTDYRFNPSKGIVFDTKINIGQKVILENSNITSIPGFENIYDDVTKPTLQMESEVDIQFFIPVKTYGTFRLRALGGWKINSAGVRLNEFYRIGGNATLRGFDEESIWSDQFVVFSGEFRLFLDRNSFLSLPFIDYGLTRVLVDDNKVTDDAIGVGLGLNFSTKAGIFNVSFAAGNRLNSGFDFGNMKVHFGYLNLF